MKGTIDCSVCGDKVDLHLHPVTGKVYWDQGHNADPLADGRACDACNDKVIDARIELMHPWHQKCGHPTDGRAN